MRAFLIFILLRYDLCKNEQNNKKNQIKIKMRTRDGSFQGKKATNQISLCMDAKKNVVSFWQKAYWKKKNFPCSIFKLCEVKLSFSRNQFLFMILIFLKVEWFWIEKLHIFRSLEFSSSSELDGNKSLHRHMKFNFASINVRSINHESSKTFKTFGDSRLAEIY